MKLRLIRFEMGAAKLLEEECQGIITQKTTLLAMHFRQ
jgi:hypothetical protein